MKDDQNTRMIELEKQVELLNNKIQNMVQYQTSLALKENIYQDVLDSIPVFVFWKDKNNNMLGFNVAYQNAINYSREELLSKTGFELFPDAEKYWIDDLEVITTGIPKLNIVEEVIIPPNKTIWFKTDKTPLKDEKGNIIGVIGVSIDITELKNTQNILDQTNKNLLQAQKELEKLNEDLDLKVKIRTKELQEVNKNLKRVNLDLDNFIYIASHDLRQPILNMEGILNYFKNPNIQQEQLDKLTEYLYVSVKKLKNTVDELSEIVKVQNNIDAELEEIGLHDLFNEVMFSLNELKQEYPSINYIINFDDVPSIRFSRKNLRSIFFNMISNSIKYQKVRSDSYLSICTRNVGDHIMLEFKDNGMGIKQEHLSQIFAMYKRFNNKGSGSGLGLYIVKRIVENYEGKIIVTSTPEVETKFEILLPL
jgi:PAS domain S-box-containing protein